MTVIGIIGYEIQFIDKIIDLFVDKYKFKSIKLVNCNRNCKKSISTKNLTPNNLNISNPLEDAEKLKKEVCFCLFDPNYSNEQMVESRIKMVFSSITSDWNSNYIVSTISSKIEFEIMSNTFFISLAIDISILSKLSIGLNPNNEILNSLEIIPLKNELFNNNELLKKLLMFLEYENNEKKTDLIKLIRKSDFCINSFDNYTDLENQINKLKIHNLNSRPNWDEYFMKIAWLTSQRSNCISRKVGSVIVKNKKIISTGYNGTPKNMKNCYEGGCNRCIDPNKIEGKSLESCACMHAEINAMLFAGIERCVGATIYVTLMPCVSCSKSIIQCEFERVVYEIDYTIPDNFSTINLLKNANIKVEKLLTNQVFKK